MKCKLRSGKHTRFEDGQAVRYLPGEVFEATQDELKMFGDRLELIQEPATIDSDAISDDVRAKLPAEPLTVTPTAAVEPSELGSIAGIGPEIAKTLEEAGVKTLADLARAAGGPELAAIAGIGKNRAAKIRKALMAIEDRPETSDEVHIDEGDGVVKEGESVPLGETIDLHETDLDGTALDQGPEQES